MQQNTKHVSFSLWRGTGKDYGRAGTGDALSTSGRDEPKHFLKQIDSAISVLSVREPTNMLYVVYIRRTCMGLANACLAVNSQH